MRPYGRCGAPLPWSRTGEKQVAALGHKAIKEAAVGVKSKLRCWTDLKGGPLPRSEFYVSG